MQILAAYQMSSISIQSYNKSIVGLMTSRLQGPGAVPHDMASRCMFQYQQCEKNVELTVCGLCFVQGQAQRISAPSGAQPAAGDDVPAIAMRVAQAFGQAATQLLTNPSNPPASAPSSDILLVGPALSPSSITGELQLQPVAKPPTTAPALAPAPSTSMTAEVASAAASLAAPILAGQGRGPTDPPKPPLHELVDAAAELPARLGILPALPGMQGAPDAGQSQQASAAAASQLQTMFTMPANQGPGVVPAQRGSVAGSGMTGVGRRMLQK